MTIKLENKLNGALRVEVKMWVAQINDYAKAQAVFDTGASKTIIDEKLADKLQLPVESINNSVTVTASGAVTTRNSILPKLRLGTEVIHSVPVSIMKLPEELKVRCIIGMNVLQEFDISISSYDRKVTLKSRPLPKKFFTDDYSITLSSVEDQSGVSDNEDNEQ